MCPKNATLVYLLCLKMLLILSISDKSDVNVSSHFFFFFCSLGLAVIQRLEIALLQMVEKTSTWAIFFIFLSLSSFLSISQRGFREITGMRCYTAFILTACLYMLSNVLFYHSSKVCSSTHPVFISQSLCWGLRVSLTVECTPVKLCEIDLVLYLNQLYLQRRVEEFAVKK